MKSQARKSKKPGEANSFAKVAMRVLIAVGVTSYVGYLVYQFFLATQKF